MGAGADSLAAAAAAATGRLAAFVRRDDLYSLWAMEERWSERLDAGQDAGRDAGYDAAEDG